MHTSLLQRLNRTVNKQQVYSEKPRNEKPQVPLTADGVHVCRYQPLVLSSV